MHMQMRYFLVSVLPDIRNHPKAAFGNTGNIGNRRDHAGKGGLFLGRCVGGKIHPVNIGPFRDHQHMDGARRADILKGKRMFVFGYSLVGNFTAQDTRKHIAVIIGHQVSSL